MGGKGKQAERYFCRELGGDRRKGGFGGDSQGAMNDCNDDVTRWSVEVKNWKRPTWGAMLSDAHKAVDRKSDGQFGIGIMHKKFHDRDENTLVYLTWTEFQALDKYIKELERGLPSNDNVLEEVKQFIEEKLNE